MVLGNKSNDAINKNWTKLGDYNFQNGTRVDISNITLDEINMERLIRVRFIFNNDNVSIQFLRDNNQFNQLSFTQNGIDFYYVLNENYDLIWHIGN